MSNTIIKLISDSDFIWTKFKQVSYDRTHFAHYAHLGKLMRKWNLLASPYVASEIMAAMGILVV